MQLKKKELKKLNVKRKIIQPSKWANELNSFQIKKYKWPINTWKMFNILSYQKNAYKNYTEIPSHPSQNGWHQENK
jgi:hypothetical protein